MSPPDDASDAGLPPGRCPRALAAWTGACARRSWTVLLLAALLTVLAGLAIATRLGVSTNTVDMLSPELPFRQHAKALNRAFPQLDDTIVAVVDAPTPERADALTDDLERRLGAVDSLTGVYRPDGPFVRRHALYYLSTDRLAALLDRLAAAQPLLATLAERPDLRGLAEMLSLGADADADLPADGLAPLLAEMAASAEALAAGKPRNLSWQALLPVQPDGAPAARRFLILTPKLDYGLLKPAKAAIADVRAAADAATADAGAGQVRLTGETVVKHQELETVERSGLLSGGLSLLGVAAILVAGLGSLRLVAASLTTLLVGLVWTAGLAAVLVGQLNIISVAFAVLFVGLGIDFAIHFGLRARESGGSGAQPLRRAGGGSGCAILLGALCAAIGFLGFWPTAYRGLAELGLISAIGMAVAAAASLTLLPALLAALGWRRRKGAPRELPLAGWIVRHRRGVLGALVLLGLSGAALAPGARFDFNPMNLRDADSTAMQLFDELAADPRTTPYTVELLAANADAAAGLARRFREAGGFGPVRTLASYVPAEQERKAGLLADAGFFLGPVLGGAASPAPLDAAQREAALADLRAAVDTLASREGAPGREAARLQAVLADAGAPDPAALERRWTVYLPQLFRLLGETVAAQPFGRDDLPPELVDRWVAPDGRTRVEVRPETALQSNAQIRRFAAAALDVTPQATGVPVVIHKAAEVVLQAFQQATAIAAVGMLVVLAVTLRRFRDVALALAPLPLAAGLTLGTAALFGLALNFANIIVLPLLLGLTVSSGIHLVVRWRQEGGAAAALASSTPRGVLLSVLTTLAAFGSLALAEHPGMSSMGTLLTIAVVHMVLAVLLGLPALLALSGRERR